uniref:Glomulin, FKBP associated protein n=1 Tax=Anser brachyrhynchus TaxID=132585 RepID=A0A8B9CCL7_9AVES
MAVDELQAIIQRCQILEESDFRGEDFNLFQVAGQKCLEDGYAAQLLEVIQNEKNKVIIKNMGWNLISPLVRCILAYKQEDDKRDDKREHCLKILDQLVQLCNPKELFLGLLEQIEQTSGEKVCPTVMLLLQPLQTVLLKLQNKKAYSVGLSLAMIMNQLTPLPVPYTKQQIQEDKLGLCQCCNAVVDFAKPFVNEVVKNMEKSSEYNDMELKEELLKFCMKSLKYPLLTAQLEQLEGIEEQPFRHFATEIIVSVVKMNYIFLHHKGKRSYWENQEFEDIERKNSADSLACLSYLMFVQHFGINCFPMVFSPSYLLQCNMTHIEVLVVVFCLFASFFSHPQDLFENCLLRMEDNSLLHQYLEFRDFINVPQDLVKVMTLCPIEHLRKKSLNMLQLFIDKFDAEGKYTLFRCLLKTSNHAGVEGYIIQKIKDQIHLSLTKAHDNVWFTRHHLISLLDLVLFLPEGAETDLLQNSDRIMASLNLLRYLVIKDCESDNQTGVWTTLAKIEKNFLKPLHVGLNMSKAHYEAEIKNKRENRRVYSLTVSEEKMPAMTTEMQLQVLHSALFTFDLIESVLARVEELIEVKVKATGIKA